MVINIAPSDLNLRIQSLSLLRSHFAGRVQASVKGGEVLFQIERARFKEVPEVYGSSGVSGMPDWRGMNSSTVVSMNEWIVFSRSAGLALRNIDHLFPSKLEGPYAPPRVDFLWARVHDDSRSGPRDLAATGFWAVRGEQAELVLGRLKAAWEAEPAATEADETRIWTAARRRSHDGGEERFDSGTFRGD